MAKSLKPTPKKCLRCNFISENEENYKEHYETHQYENNFFIPCFYCSTTIKNIRGYKKHIKSCKVQLKLYPKVNVEPTEESLSESESYWQCKLCTEKIKLKKESNFEDFDKVSKHCKPHARSESVACPGCDRVYTSYQVDNITDFLITLGIKPST